MSPIHSEEKVSEKYLFGMDDLDARVEQTMRSTDAACPCCAADIFFSPEKGTMACAHCGWEGEITFEMDDAVVKHDYIGAELKGGFAWGAEKKAVYCKSCGAHIVLDSLQVSINCPFCGSSQVSQETFADSHSPNGVLPFSISNQKAAELFIIWLKKKNFVSKEVKEGVKPENIYGIYVPYWAFDAHASARYSASAGYNYTVSTGNTTQTHIRWQTVNGSYAIFYSDVLILASTRHQNKPLQDVQPFDLRACKPYRPEFVSGFISERYSVGLKEGFSGFGDEVNRRLLIAISAYARQQARADHIRDVKFNANLSKIQYSYVLLPFWKGSFEYKGKNYDYVVNGQTGKVNGSVPRSIGALLWVIIGLAVIAVVAGAVNMFSNTDVTVTTMVAGAEQVAWIDNKSLDLPNGFSLVF